MAERRKTTTREPALRYVEGVLWAWAVWRRSLPAPPISTVYEAETAPSRLAHSSQQERYVTEHQRELQVEAVIRRLPPRLRRLVWARYVQDLGVGRTIRLLHISRGEFYRMRRDVLGRLADAIVRGEVSY